MGVAFIEGADIELNQGTPGRRDTPTYEWLPSLDADSATQGK